MYFFSFFGEILRARALITFYPPRAGRGGGQAALDRCRDGEGLLQPADVVSGPWRVVGNGDAFDLPTVSRDEIDEEWLSSFPVPIPEETIRQWERDGCGVVRRREYVPYRMPDGRQLVVPMDKYEIRYVGRPAL